MDMNLKLEAAFFKALGRAVTSWQRVEAAAYLIYVTMMKCPNPMLVSATFYHIQSFDSRVQLLDRCAHFGVPGALNKQWADLHKRLTDLSGLRNRLVHFAYVKEGRNNIQTPTLGPSALNALVIVPKKRGKPPRPPGRIDQDDLEQARRDFDKLAKDLQAFRGALAAAIAS